MAKEPGPAAQACAAWLDGLSEGWWDDAADGGQFLDSLEEAFTAGWEARDQRRHLKSVEFVPVDEDDDKW